MKQLTVSFSMPRTTKTIILTWIIISAVSLSVLASTTVSAVPAYEYPYVMAVDDTVYISNGEFILAARDANMTTSGYGFYGMYSLGDNVLKLVYSTGLDDWTAEEILLQEDNSKIFYRLGTDTRYNRKYIIVVDSPQQSPADFWASKSIITNVNWNETEISIVGSYSNDLTQLPQGLTENDIKSIINNQINRETLVGALATQIRLDTEEDYQKYQTGDITHTQMQQVLTDNATTLNQMIPDTLLDAIEINNALTYNQTIQQIITSTSSDIIKDQILSCLENAAFAIFEYQQGLREQTEVLTIVGETQTLLMSFLIDGTASTVADINAVNAAVNAIESLKNSIVEDTEDIDKNVAEGVQQSDFDELMYLDQMLIDSGHQTVTDISPMKNFTQTQKNDAKQLMNVIWENEFVKRLVPLCAGFMVVCVALGVKYKV